MENETIDFKITKRHFPRINNDSVLEFVFEKDPNLFMRKNKIVIKGAIEIDRNGLNILKSFTMIAESNSFKWICCRKWFCFETVLNDECRYRQPNRIQINK